VSSKPDNHDQRVTPPAMPGDLPADLLRYTLPSRYCDSDKLINFAWEKFGKVEHGWPRVQAISQWVHDNIEYRFMSGRPDLSAWDVLTRGYGVCRDFAHLAIALNRTFNIPARYVTGHLPDMGFPDPEGHMDFHAYGEVYLGKQWFTTDARFHVPRIGRIMVSCGLDAVDGAFSTIYGGADLTYFQVWAYQVARGTVGIGDPLDFSVRLDNQWAVRRDPGL
jgi:transglutaminase-like putative cysteine protease